MFYEFILTICVFFVVYSYLIYPPLVWVLARALGRLDRAPELRDQDLPPLTLVLAAYNEELVIEDRLHNALAMDYPRDRFEVIVGTDGCRDRTVAIVRGFAGSGVRLMEFAENRGKASVLNDAVSSSTGTIILMSDANTQVDPGAARRLARWFHDPRVGAAVGRLVLIDPKSGRNADGLYWKYETFLKRCEARLGALLGANGAIYAIRRELYEPIPAGTIVDDFVIPLLVKQRTGCRIVYDPEAVALEETPVNVRDEFHRRARIGAGGYQSIGMLWKLLDPRRGWIAFTFLSHKILRWLCPFFLIGAMVANLGLLERTFYRWVLAAQIGFYIIAVLMAFIPARVRIVRPLRLTTMFVSMNAALLIGFSRWMTGHQKGSWRRTSRAGDPVDSSR